MQMIKRRYVPLIVRQYLVFFINTNFVIFSFFLFFNYFIIFILIKDKCFQIVFKLLLRLVVWIIYVFDLLLKSIKKILKLRFLNNWLAILWLIRSTRIIGTIFVINICIPLLNKIFNNTLQWIDIRQLINSIIINTIVCCWLKCLNLRFRLLFRLILFLIINCFALLN